MFVPQMALNGRNPSTDIFRWGEERKCHQLAEEEARAGESTALSAYKIPLVPVSYSKYLWRALSVADDDWPAVVPKYQEGAS